MEKKGMLSKLVLFGGIVILIITIFLVAFKENKYEKLENSMLATTKSLVKNNMLKVNKNYYFTLNEMGIKDTYDCSKDSGVYIVKLNNEIIYNTYLVCDSYTSEKASNAKGKYIEIIGANPLIVETNTNFIDPGYDSKGYRVETISNVQQVPGVYNVFYYVYDNSERVEVVNRYVIVSDVASSEAPTITLKGDEKVSLKIGANYIEPGYTANDDADGEITNRVIVSSNVNSSKIGDYEVTYKVTNSKGLTTTKKRMVSVVKEINDVYTEVTLDPDTKTNQNVKVYVKIESSNYNYTVLQDGEVYNTKDFHFDVSKNDDYTLKIYDKNGNYVEKKVVVDNIDKTSPQGLCQVTSSGNSVTYKVTASDESGIKGYSYNTGNGFTEYMRENTFKYVMDYNDASVIIQDMAGNANRISCNVTKISDITDVSVPSTISLYVGDTYEIPITLTPSSASKSEVTFELLSGKEYVSLENHTLKGLNVGNAIVKLSVKNSTMTKMISVDVKSKSSNLVSPTAASQSELAAAAKYSDEAAASGAASWCTKHSGYMQATYNGRKLSYDEVITASVGQTITIKLDLISSCGNIELLTRTTADGQTGWREWASGKSVPSVNRNNPGTFISTSSYNWVITANKRTNGGAVILSQTSTIRTNLYNEIKAFFRIRLVIK